jgi:ribosome modulation factor
MEIHNEGRAAFYAGAKATESPYAACELRSRWVKGWYDAEHDRCVTRATEESVPYVMSIQERLL